MQLWTAFMVGLVGSVHCVGMCGPIAMALPYGRQRELTKLKNILLYNSGRIFTYSLMGAVIGLVGKGFFVAGVQSEFSIIIGILLLIVAIFSIDVETKVIAIPFVDKLMVKLQQNLSRLLKKHTGNSLFMVGVLNGFLPCGLVYFAIVGAVSTGQLVNGILYMAFFGLGTLPMMLSISFAGSYVSVKFRNTLKKMYPVFLIGFAVLFILRGFNVELLNDFRFFETNPGCAPN